MPRIGGIKLEELPLSRIELFYTQLIEGGVGTLTIREVHAILHLALKKAVNYGYIQSNPANGASLPRYSRNEMHVFDKSHFFND